MLVSIIDQEYNCLSHALVLLWSWLGHETWLSLALLLICYAPLSCHGLISGVCAGKHIKSHNWLKKKPQSMLSIFKKGQFYKIPRQRFSCGLSAPHHHWHPPAQVFLSSWTRADLEVYDSFDLIYLLGRFYPEWQLLKGKEISRSVLAYVVCDSLRILLSLNFFLLFFFRIFSHLFHLCFPTFTPCLSSSLTFVW